MKSWVFLVAAIIGGYYAYHALWGADGEPSEEPKEAVRLIAAAPESVASADDETGAAQPPPMSLDRGLASGTDSVAAAPLVAQDPEAEKLGREWAEAIAAGKGAAMQVAEEALLTRFPESDAARRVSFERGKQYLAKFRTLGQSVEGLAAAQQARLSLTRALFMSQIDAGALKSLRVTLEELTQVVLFSGRHVEGVTRSYTPRSGDTLGELCRKQFRAWGSQSSPGFLCAVNRLRGPTDLRAGEPIKVPLGAARIEVVKSQYRLYFLVGDAYVADFPVGLGKLGSTPVADFVIEKKLKNPDWFPSPGVKIPYGDPQNVLGTRWMGFKNTPEFRGFGIHGTTDPSSIGREESSGCVRMHTGDVERLFEWAPEGTGVRVRR